MTTGNHKADAMDVVLDEERFRLASMKTGSQEGSQFEPANEQEVGEPTDSESEVEHHLRKLQAAAEHTNSARQREAERVLRKAEFLARQKANLEQSRANRRARCDVHAEHTAKAPAARRSVPRIREPQRRQVRKAE